MKDYMKKISIKNLLIRMMKNLLPASFFLFIKKQYYKISPKLFLPEKEAELNILKYIVREGDYVIDVGANIGIYTKHLSKLVGKKGKVISIEPISDTYDVLRSNIKFFKLNNVDTYNIAISDKDGVVKMVIPKSEFGNENYYEAKITSQVTEGNEYSKIKAVTLDSLTKNIGNTFTFVKIDVEGHELNCIRGAKKFLIKSRPILLIEVSSNPDSYSSPAYELFNELTGLGYSAFWLDDSIFIKRKMGIDKLNYFFFTEKQISSFQNLINRTIVKNE